MVSQIGSIVFILASFMIAIISFFIAFCMLRRVDANRAATCLYWVAGCAFIIGEGVWSLHFITMIAYNLNLNLAYDIAYVLLSMFIIIGASFISILVYSFSRGRMPLQVLSSVVLALGVGGMHYVGMLSQCFGGDGEQRALAYPSLFIGSICVLGLTAYSTFQNVQNRRQTRNVLFYKAFLLTCAVLLLHYCGFFQGDVKNYSMMEKPLSLGGLSLSIGISVLDMVTIGYSLVILVIDRRLTKSEAKLKQLNHNYSLILNTVAEGIYGVDQEGVTTFMNPAAAKLTGYSLQETIGRPVHDLIHDCESEHPGMVQKECSVCMLRQDRERYVAEDRFRRKDGTLFPVEYSVTPILECGHAVGAVVNFTDISDRKKNDELILTSEKLSVAGQLAAGIAHEIRNPLTAISGFVQLMKEGAQAKREYLDIILSELSRVELIVSELLMLAKPQASRFSEHDLRKLLQSVVSLLETQAIMRDIQIHAAYDSEPLMIYCDEGQIKQVFINLIKNAIEAMPQGGDISVRSIQEEGGAVTHICDNGCGMPDAVLSKIGQPFYTTKAQGTGLGLMISNRIVTHHKGTMDVSSLVNEGTQFIIKLPLAAARSESSLSLVEGTDPQAAAGTEKAG